MWAIWSGAAAAGAPPPVPRTTWPRPGVRPAGPKDASGRGAGTRQDVSPMWWRLTLDRVQVPLARDALERMRPAILEGDPRAGDEVGDRPRHEDLAGAGQGADPGADVHGDAGDV